uniref:Tetratricopeptide repeat protein n=1 Tax=Spumella elongata TaxID=89044 RepID=A0A7S3M2N5_9STRA
MNQRTVGMFHPETASIYNSMGTLFQDISDPVASFGQFTKCLEIQRETVGETNPDVANTYNNMATVLYQQGRSEEAAGLLKKAIQILDATSAPKLSPERLLYEENLEEVLKSAGSADGSAASITADA